MIIQDILKIGIFFLLPFFVFTIIVKASASITKYYKKSSCDSFGQTEMKIILAQLLLFIIGELMYTLLPVKLLTINNDLFFKDIFPVLSIVSLCQLLFFIGFWVFPNQKTRYWANFRACLIIFTIGSIITQLVIASWTIFNSFLLTPSGLVLLLLTLAFIYYAIYKMFYENVLVIKQMIVTTFQILLRIKRTNAYLNKGQILKDQAKKAAIAKLWSFQTEEKDNQHTFNIKIIRITLIFFLVSFRKLLSRTIKEQEIIINGWKKSLQE